MNKFSPFDATLWFATAASAPQTFPLEDRVVADVCIVGAGFTGLTTALELAKKGVNVAVLEAQGAGFGGSGRNAGHCTPTFTHYSLSEIRRMLGEPWAERLIARQTQAFQKVTEYIQRYSIECEWIHNGYIMGALHPGKIEALKRKRDEYNNVGARTRLLDKAEVEEMTGSPRFLGAWYHQDGGHLNPLGYARGLARAAIQEGVALYTDSKVTDVVAEAGKWLVRTSRGGVLADKVIFATGAYTVEGWPRLEESFRIMKVFVAATQPLSAQERTQVLPHNTTMHDGRGDIYVYKYNAEGRIVASMFPMGKRGKDMTYTRMVMSDRLKWLHPQISQELRWDYFWFGELDMQYRTIPRLYGLAPGIVALTGLSGRGVPTGSMLGGILCEWALGVPENQLSLKVEPLHIAPLYMRYGPHASLRYYRAEDWVKAKLGRIDLPPHS